MAAVSQVLMGIPSLRITGSIHWLFSSRQVAVLPWHGRVGLGLTASHGMTRLRLQCLLSSMESPMYRTRGSTAIDEHRGLQLDIWKLLLQRLCQTFWLFNSIMVRLTLSLRLRLLFRRTRVVNYIRIELRPPIRGMIRIQNIGGSLTTGCQCHLMIPLRHAQSSSLIIDIFACFYWIPIIIAIFAFILLLPLLELAITRIRIIWIRNRFLPSEDNSHLATLIAR